jgi:hypothetical protein
VRDSIRVKHYSLKPGKLTCAKSRIIFSFIGNNIPQTWGSREVGQYLSHLGSGGFVT